MSTMSRAEYKAAILAAAESGALKEALEYYHLTRMAFRFVDENAWAATMTHSITRDDYNDFKRVFERLGLELPVKFRESKSRRRDYTFRTGVGYDWVDDDLLGGDGSGEVRKAFEDSGLRFSF